MDGMLHSMRALNVPMLAGSHQQTLKTAIDCIGIGLHSGRKVTMRLTPAEADHGIVFRRTDLGRDLPAHYAQVVDTRLATVLGDVDDGQVRVSTVEHLMAALMGCGIDNALIEINGPELPALDGSAGHLVFLIDCAGIAPQDAPRRVIEVVRPVRVTEGDAYAELGPAMRARGGLELTLSIDFAAEAIGQQELSLRLTPESFRGELARARTFALAEDIAGLRAAGLAQGGSLDNAVVVDAGRVLNPGGLRMADEFVRHKLLDAVGDLALAGAALSGRFVAHRSGHGLNNKLLRALMADSSAWRMRDAAPVAVAA
jgi:UDP-3-O-[3-hydroxymyristoyl] N-acetylglucosamine deacetylase